ncbi:hypothetical protein [Halostagnicola sp. A-GB9-2]|uniref:hypothetical protein n=1 Tax=Halostagnicola sp. A-GB9-2 TaxID=3048066 RepID=UPI0024C00DF5|nr:hypothetical protein [Halostagnicola sp. A-GB9-2]MDJ1433087.1 hypothetical protein [Halostagnicola sp. A-GB9-2]
MRASETVVIRKQNKAYELVNSEGDEREKRENPCEETTANTPGGQKRVEFGEDKKVINIFACPDYKETIKSTGENADGKSKTSTLGEFTPENDNESASEGTEMNGSDTFDDMEYAGVEGLKFATNSRSRAMGCGQSGTPTWTSKNAISGASPISTGTDSGSKQQYGS